MSYKLQISKKAKKFIKDLPKQDALKVMQAIEGLQEDPRPRWIEKLKGIKKGNFFRIAQGNYRILYSIEDSILLVSVVEVNGRDDCYKKLNQKLK